MSTTTLIGLAQTNERINFYSLEVLFCSLIQCAGDHHHRRMCVCVLLICSHAAIARHYAYGDKLRKDQLFVYILLVSTV